LGGKRDETATFPRDNIAFCQYIRRLFMNPFTTLREKFEAFRYMALLNDLALNAVALRYLAMYHESLREAVNEEWVIAVGEEDWKERLLDRLNAIGQ